jgi:nucleotidyltransferase/DNA polymerase involved in DNA repair
MNSSPMAIWKCGFDTWRMLAEAQTVVAFRMMGMAGLWTLAEGETTRMFTEKQQAFAQSAMDGAAAAMRGQSPERVLAAAVRPLGRKTAANAQRLGRSYWGQFR